MVRQRDEDEGQVEARGMKMRGMERDEDEGEG